MYIGLLETGLFEAKASLGGKVDVEALQAGARRLHLGPATEWKWKVEDGAVKLSGAEDVGFIRDFEFERSIDKPSSSPS